MLHIVNFANGGFIRSQQLQNQEWFRLYGNDVTIHSFGNESIKDLVTFELCSRGTSFYQWKIILLHKVLPLCKYNDLLMYMDSGAFPHTRIESLAKHSVNLFKVADPMFPPNKLLNKFWCKKETINFFSTTKTLQKYLNAPQVCGGFQLYKVDDFSTKFISELRDVNLKGHLIDDSQTVKQYPFFKDHRHDQSILTCMSVKYGIPVQGDQTQITNLKNPKFILHRGNI